jgi:K+-transporting ATPase ATPase C chain
MESVTTLAEREREAVRPTKTSYGQMLRISVAMTIVLTILVGGIYPFFMTGAAQVLFHDQANGSLIKGTNGQIVGSSLIGQSFTKPQYFHPRASAAGSGYDASNSAGTNLGPTSTHLLTTTVALADAIRKEDGLPPNYVLPSDAASTSASGLDPNISPAYAALQVPRVARVRGLSQTQVQALVQKYTSGRDLGVLGDPRVNVLQLNIALDEVKK